MKPAASLGVCLGAFAGILALAFANIEIARHDLGVWNGVLMLAVCALQVALVAGVLMHLSASAPVIRLLAVASFLWVGFMVFITFADYISRPWQENPDSWELKPTTNVTAAAEMAAAMAAAAATNAPGATNAPPATNAPAVPAASAATNAPPATNAPAAAPR